MLGLREMKTGPTDLHYNLGKSQGTRVRLFEAKKERLPASQGRYYGIGDLGSSAPSSRAMYNRYTCRSQEESEKRKEYY